MVCVNVCVVFMIIASISGHVLNRSQTDLERALKQHYDFTVFRKPMDNDSHKNLHTETSHHTTEEEQVNSPRRVLTMSYKDFSGPPLQFYKNMELKDDKTSNSFRQAANEEIPQEVLDSIFTTSIQEPVGESSALRTYKRINDKDATKHKNKIEIDLNVLKSIWNSSSDGQNKTDNTLMFKIDMKNISSLADVLIMKSVNESGLATNGTGSTFSNEDRFLSERILRNSWLQNVDNGEKPATTVTSRHVRMQPAPQSAVIPNNYIIVPSSGNNTSTKHDLSKFIAIATFISVVLFK